MLPENKNVSGNAEVKPDVPPQGTPQEPTATPETTEKTAIDELLEKLVGEYGGDEVPEEQQEEQENEKPEPKQTGKKEPEQLPPQIQELLQRAIEESKAAREQAVQALAKVEEQQLEREIAEFKSAHPEIGETGVKNLLLIQLAFSETAAKTGSRIPSISEIYEMVRGVVDINAVKKQVTEEIKQKLKEGEIVMEGGGVSGEPPKGMSLDEFVQWYKNQYGGLPPYLNHLLKHNKEE